MDNGFFHFFYLSLYYAFAGNLVGLFDIIESLLRFWKHCDAFFCSSFACESRALLSSAEEDSRTFRFMLG